MSGNKNSPPIITLEDHFLAKAFQYNGSPVDNHELASFPEALINKLKDVSEMRIPSMDKANIALQVVSHTPGSSSAPADKVRAANDELAEHCETYPKRLMGFAALSMNEPTAAVAELERCVKHLGFLGALLDSHTRDGEYYDDSKYWPVFDAAERLGVVIYIHPMFPTSQVSKAIFAGNYSSTDEAMLATAAFGWHSDVAIHVLRLYAAGVFDKFPKLKLVIGHMGEMLPFMLERTQRVMNGFRGQGKAKRSLLDVWDENIWITTSGFFSVNPLATILRNTKLERIMLSVDYPFSEHAMSRQYVEDLRGNEIVDEDQLERMAYKNAEKLFGISISS